MNKYQVVTLFPNLIEEWKKVGIINQALKKNLLEISSINLRNYGIGEYKQVDDSPYGGGPGMVLMPEPLDNAIVENKAKKNVFLTPSGQQLNENLIEELLNYESLNFICGRYEGFDQRVLDIHADYEVSVGQSVVSGGEIPALYVLEALIRRIPNVLGNPESLVNETFVNNQKDFPVYTRPETYKDHKVPDVLLSGNHKEIDNRIPFNVGMKELVKMDKGCYPGQEIHARLESRGKLTKTLVRLSCQNFLKEGEYKSDGGGKIIITTAYDGKENKSKFLGIIPIKYVEMDKIVLTNGIEMVIEDVVSFQSLNFHR